jgi:hypothetical protein
MVHQAIGLIALPMEMVRYLVRHLVAREISLIAHRIADKRRLPCIERYTSPIGRSYSQPLSSSFRQQAQQEGNSKNVLGLPAVLELSPPKQARRQMSYRHHQLCIKIHANPTGRGCSQLLSSSLHHPTQQETSRKRALDRLRKVVPV